MLTQYYKAKIVRNPRISSNILNIRITELVKFRRNIRARKFVKTVFCFIGVAGFSLHKNLLYLRVHQVLLIILLYSCKYVSKNLTFRYHHSSVVDLARRRHFHMMQNFSKFIFFEPLSESSDKMNILWPSHPEAIKVLNVAWDSTTLWWIPKYVTFCS